MSTRKGDYRGRVGARDLMGEALAPRAPLPADRIMDDLDGLSRERRNGGGSGRARTRGEYRGRLDDRSTNQSRTARRSFSPPTSISANQQSQRSNYDRNPSDNHSNDRERRNKDVIRSPPTGKGNYTGSARERDDDRRRPIETSHSSNGMSTTTRTRDDVRGRREDKFSKQRQPPAVSTEGRNREAHDDGERPSRGDLREHPTVSTSYGIAASIDPEEGRGHSKRLRLEDTAADLPNSVRSMGGERHISPSSTLEHNKPKGVYERPSDRIRERDRPPLQESREARDRERVLRYAERERKEARETEIDKKWDNYSAGHKSSGRSYGSKSNSRKSSKRSVSPPPAIFRSTYRRPRSPSRSHSRSHSRSRSRSKSPAGNIFSDARHRSRHLPHSSSSGPAAGHRRSVSPASSAHSYIHSGRKRAYKHKGDRQETVGTKGNYRRSSRSRSRSVSPPRRVTAKEGSKLVRGRTNDFQQKRSERNRSRSPSRSPLFPTEQILHRSKRARSRSIAPDERGNSYSPRPMSRSFGRQQHHDLEKRGSFERSQYEQEAQQNAGRKWSSQNTSQGRRSSPFYDPLLDEGDREQHMHMQMSRHNLISLPDTNNLSIDTQQPSAGSSSVLDRSLTMPVVYQDSPSRYSQQEQHLPLQAPPFQLYSEHPSQASEGYDAEAITYYNSPPQGQMFLPPPPPSFPLPPLQYTTQQQQQQQSLLQQQFEPRHLSIGIRAPPPGPKSSGVKGFRPIAGFVPITSQSTQAYVKRGDPELRKYFESEDSAPNTPLNGSSGHAMDLDMLPPSQSHYGYQQQFQGSQMAHREQDTQRAVYQSPFGQGQGPPSNGLPTPPRLAYRAGLSHPPDTERQALPPQDYRSQQQHPYIQQHQELQYVNHQQQQQQQRTPTLLPSAHAPLFPSLGSTQIGAILPAPPSKLQPPPSPVSAPATPSTLAGLPPLPSPAGSNASGAGPAGLPAKPSFSTLLPAFLPQKPNFGPLPVSASGTSTPTSSMIPLPSGLPAPPIQPYHSQAQSHPLGPSPASRTGVAEQLSPIGISLRQDVSTSIPLGLHQSTTTPTQQRNQQSLPVPPSPSLAFVTGAASLPAKPITSSNPMLTSPAKPYPSILDSSNVDAASAPVTLPDPVTSVTTTSVLAIRPAGGMSELYERLAQVGEGTYGKVYKARNHDTGGLVGLKRIRMEAEKDGFPVTSIREIKLLQSLNHENVVKLQEMMVSKGHVYMVFEYVDHDLTGILHHPSVNFTSANLKSLMSQLLHGLDYIHWRGVLHRDLKGSNILLSKYGELKIADFGLAKFYAKGKKNDYTNRVITQWYKPPELLFGATVYGPEVDMWSAGCIFLELFVKRPVFQGQDEIHQLDVIYKLLGTPSLSDWPALSQLPWYELVKPKQEIHSTFRAVFSAEYIKSGAALDLAEALMSFNPSKRPTALEALQMPYFTKEEPAAERATWLAEIKGDWHEMESKEASRRKGKEVRKAQQRTQNAQQPAAASAGELS